MIGEARNSPLADHFGDGILDFQSSFRVADKEYLLQRFPDRLVLGPAGQVLGNAIQ